MSSFATNQAGNLPVQRPVPPSLPWLLALLIAPAWAIKQASFVKRIDAQARANVFAVIALVLLAIGGAILWNAYTIVREVEDRPFEAFVIEVFLWVFFGVIPGWLATLQGLMTPFLLCVAGGCVFMITTAFSLRNSLHRYYGFGERFGLRLSGPMTFFFNIAYIQYHLNRIARRSVEQPC